MADPNHNVSAAGKLARARGYVLAGGGSTRFGRDKALAEIDGKPMIRRMSELLATITNEVHVIAAPAAYASLGVQAVADRWPGEGPLGGIITALRQTEQSDPPCAWNLMVSCDMPFLTREWLAFLGRRAAASDAQVVLPRSHYGLEPLCACYKTEARTALEAIFEKGVRKVTQALQQLPMEVLAEVDWKQFDGAGRLFWNMNTPADYDEAKRILEAGHS